MDTEHIRLDVTGPVARITLDAPGRNALSIRMQTEIRAALAVLADDPRVRVLVIDGAGGAFCSGAALDGLGGGDASGNANANANANANGSGNANGRDGGGESLGQVVAAQMDALSNPMIREIRAFPHPVVSVVAGAAAGAGASLVLAADVTLAGESGFFLFPFVPKLGLVPDLGANWTLVNRLGEARAMGLALMGGRLTATRAAEWGLIWQAVPDDALAEATDTLCAALAAAPPGMAGALRGLFAEARQSGFDPLLDREARQQAGHLDSPAFAEGRRAFLEKRAPVFATGDGGPPGDRAERPETAG